MVSWEQIESEPLPPGGERIAWGDDPFQFGELRLPDGDHRHPVVVIIHGGCWLADYDLDYMAHLAAWLNDAGVATWSLEYRRLGNAGGGWPGTFSDIVDGVDHLSVLADSHPIDPDRVAWLGHSAGAHLALWLAGRRAHADRAGPARASEIAPQAVIALAPITDLKDYAAGEGSCNRALVRLLDGPPDKQPARYAAASPLKGLPTGAGIHLVHGRRDAIVDVDHSRVYAEQARAAGDSVDLSLIDEAGHFDPVAPFSPHWKEIADAIEPALRRLR